jgi:type II secretory pathway component PulF
MLNRVSDSLDFEVDNGLRRATALVEPVIVLVMGGFVAFVVLSVLLPIFNAQDVVK